MQIADARVFDFANARRLILDIFGDSFATIETCRKVVKSNMMELKKFDGFFWLEEAFLEHAHDNMIQDRLRKSMLAVCPSHREKHAASQKGRAGGRSSQHGTSCDGSKEEPRKRNGVGRERFVGRLGVQWTDID